MHYRDNSNAYTNQNTYDVVTTATVAAPTDECNTRDDETDDNQNDRSRAECRLEVDISNEIVTVDNVDTLCNRIPIYSTYRRIYRL